MKRAISALFVFGCLCAGLAAAQSHNEIGLLLGGSRAAGGPASTQATIGSGLVYQATYAHLWSAHAIEAGFEMPFAAIPSQDVRSTLPNVPRNFASIFITPGVRAKFLPKSSVSPWGAVGAGYARFAESTTLVTGVHNTSRTGTNKGAVQFGGGVDVRTPLRVLLPITLRGEVRDFYSGQPRLNAVRGTGQHTVVFGGGLVLEF